jgi:glycine cleavage system H protein
MSDLRYTRDHEWIRMEGDVGVVGISVFAQEQLGDVVFVGLPEVGRKLGKGQEAATVESVKAASEIYAPLAGEVVAVNAALADDPSLVNSDPTGKGWFVKIRIADRSELDGLMDDAAYAKFVAEQG